MEKSALNDQTINEYMYLLYQTASDKPIDAKRFNACDLSTVHLLARANGLSSYIAVALGKSGLSHPLFEHDRNVALRHQMILENEGIKVMDMLEKAGITHAPLKGMFTKELYPAFATRIMGDIDILIDKRDRKKAISVLKEAGFTSDHIDPEYHDTLSKKNVIIELHSALLHEGPSKDWLRFNKRVFEHLSPVFGFNFRKSLSAEDHYIYTIAHAYKHTFATGIGLRFLLDLWYFKQNYSDLISSDYLRKTLRNMLLEDYEHEALRLSDLLFSDGAAFMELDENDKLAIKKYIDSGVNGKPGAASDVITELGRYKDKGLIASYIGILKFLGSKPEWYALRSPFAYRHKWARPFYVMKLGVKTLVRKKS